MKTMLAGLIDHLLEAFVPKAQALACRQPPHYLYCQFCGWQGTMPMRQSCHVAANCSVHCDTCLVNWTCPY